jgi:hypothetical protein
MMMIITIIIIIIITARYESSVFVMISKGLDNKAIAVRFPSKVIYFSLLPNTKMCTKVHSASHIAGNGAPFHGSEAVGPGNNQLTLFGAKVWRYIPFRPYAFMALFNYAQVQLQLLLI